LDGEGPKFQATGSISKSGQLEAWLDRSHDDKMVTWKWDVEVGSKNELEQANNKAIVKIDRSKVIPTCMNNWDPHIKCLQ
jgi:hypothetical protein